MSHIFSSIAACNAAKCMTPTAVLACNSRGSAFQQSLLRQWTHTAFQLSVYVARVNSTQSDEIRGTYHILIKKLLLEIESLLAPLNESQKCPVSVVSVGNSTPCTTPDHTADCLLLSVLRDYYSHACAEVISVVSSETGNKKAADTFPFKKINSWVRSWAAAASDSNEKKLATEIVQKTSIAAEHTRQDTVATSELPREKKGKTELAPPTAEEIAARREAAKAAKAEKAAKAAEAVAEKEKLTKLNAFPSHHELELRVGKIVSITKHHKADRLFVEQIDLAEAEHRTIVSGLVQFYTAEELQGKLVMVLANMKPKKLQDVMSHGMVMCAEQEVNGNKVVKVVEPPQGSVPGMRIQIGPSPYPDCPAPVVKHILDLVAKLRVENDADGTIIFQDSPEAAKLSLSVGDQSIVCNEMKGAYIK